MAMVKRRRTTVGAALAASALVAAMLGAAPGPQAAAATASGSGSGCSATAESVVRMAKTERTTMRRVYYDSSGRVRYSETRTVRGPVDLGTTTLTLLSCKRDGRWRLLGDVEVDQPHRDVVLTVDGGRVTQVAPRSGKIGYTVVHRRTSGGTVEMEALRCVERPQGLGAGLYRTAKGLLEIPTPVKYWVSVGAYAVSKILPDAPEERYWCSRISRLVEIPYGFTRTGRVYLKWGKLPGDKVIRTATRTYQQDCTTVPYCADIIDEIVLVTKPS